MAQLKKTATVTNGSQSVSIAGDVHAQIRKNFIFMVENAGAQSLVPYTVAADSTFDGTNTIFSLTGFYQGASSTTAAAVIATDFTYPDMIPTIAQGDVGTAAVFTAAMYRVQQMVVAISPEGLAEATDAYQGMQAALANIGTQVTAVTANAAAALASKNAAATSETNAAASATAANTSKNNAATSATNASTSEANALAYRNTASTHATTATNKAAEAATSATNANTSATNAATSEANALAYRNTASTHATTATTRAGEAATSATNAATSATNAANSASSIGTAETTTLGYRNAAQTAATKAQAWADADAGVQVETGKYSAKHWAQQVAQQLTGGVFYRGTFNASGGTFPAPADPAKAGDLWKVTTAGTVSGTQLSVGDNILYNGSTWDKIDNSDAVTSVNGYTGAVALSKGDVGLGSVDNVSAANLRDRSTHTGTQLASTISDFAATVRSTVATGLSTATNAAIAATDTFLAALGKLQAQLTAHFGAGGTAHADATTSVSGFMSGSDKTKLNGVASGATANSTDAVLLARANHTGTQLASTISDFATTARGTTLAGIDIATDGTVSTSDTILSAIGKVYAKAVAHIARTDNPHGTTKTHVGLGNVDNTSDANKPVSTAQQTALNLKANSAAPTLTGAIALNGSVRRTPTAVAALDIDCSANNSFTKTINANSTFTFSNVPTSGTDFGFKLKLVHTSGTITWPAGVIWPEGTAPTLTTGKTHLFYFTTDNAGSTWRATVAKNYAS